MDPIEQFKANQKIAWSTFAPAALFNQLVAPHVVRFAGIERGEKVLDVGCGTGVVALTAARRGADVCGLDLTPELLAVARENAELAELRVEWREGDVEALPYADDSFDVVVSQFGHMFAPRPEVAIREMLRVLRPGGRIAFATWPIELFIGRWFATVSKYGPPPPPGVAAPPLWGDPNVVRERLGNAVKDIFFDRGVLRMPVLSPRHARLWMEANIGPVGRTAKALESDIPKRERYRVELESLISVYFEDNVLREDYLLSRAVKT
jgi:SAM-dependent methyltransferase